MSWLNGDGLYVKFAGEEGDTQKGGQISTMDGEVRIQFYIDYTDVLSATPAILGSAAGANDGSFGVVVPEGLRIQSLTVLTETAPLSSGTVASANLVIGLKKNDRSTELDHDGFTTASFVIGTVLESVGESVTHYSNAAAAGSSTTGSGVLYGTTLSEDGVIVVSNSVHASHPYTQGRWRCTLRGFYPNVGNT